MKVKQNIISFLLGIAFTVTIGAVSTFEFTLSNDTLYVDGVRSDKSLYKYGGSNHPNLRDTAEMLGADVAYNDGRIDITTIKQGTVQDVAKQADNCVYIAMMKDTTQKATASGVLWGEDYILTNKHVVEQLGVNKWIAEGNKDIFDRYYCTQVKTFESHADIALIKTDRPHGRNTKIGDSDKVKVGDDVVVISSPRSIKNVVASGKVTKIQTVGAITTFASDVSTSPGSSGGGVFNMQGELIGIVYGAYENERITTAISINTIKDLAE